MPPFHLPVEIGLAEGSRFQRLIAQMDPNITYAVFPATVLTMLGVAPAWSQVFPVAAGGQREVQLAEIRIRLDGQERTTVCVFGVTGARPALGRHTLEAFGLAADEAGETLAAVGLILG